MNPWQEAEFHMSIYHYFLYKSAAPPPPPPPGRPHYPDAPVNNINDALVAATMTVATASTSGTSATVTSSTAAKTTATETAAAAPADLTESVPPPTMTTEETDRTNPTTTRSPSPAQPPKTTLETPEGEKKRAADSSTTTEKGKREDKKKNRYQILMDCMVEQFPEHLAQFTPQNSIMQTQVPPVLNTLYVDHPALQAELYAARSHIVQLEAAARHYAYTHPPPRPAGPPLPNKPRASTTKKSTATKASVPFKNRATTTTKTASTNKASVPYKPRAITTTATTTTAAAKRKAPPVASPTNSRKCPKVSTASPSTKAASTTKRPSSPTNGGMRGYRTEVPEDVKERLSKESLSKERLSKERLSKERLSKERLSKERLSKERLQAAQQRRLERQRVLRVEAQLSLQKEAAKKEAERVAKAAAEEAARKAAPPPKPAPPPPPPRTFEERMVELEHFYKGNGHYRVPTRQPGLGRWVSDIRLARKIIDELPRKAESMKLTPERIAMLTDIGFEWDASPVSMGWQFRYEELVAYKEKHGNTEVPRNFKENKQLGEWVCLQRKLKKQNATSLTPERQEKLNAVGFTWSMDVTKPSFEDRLEECRAFRRKHSHLNVPPPYKNKNNDLSELTKDEISFCRWAVRQREEYRKYNAGFRTKSLTKTRIRQLDELGFYWDTEADARKSRTRGNRGKELNEQHFAERVAELAAIKATHGECCDLAVLKKAGYGESSSLYHFVHAQRRNWKGLQAGKKSPLTPERILKLQGVGFQFAPRKHYAPYGSCKGRNQGGSASSGRDDDDDKEENHDHEASYAYYIPECGGSVGRCL